MRLAGSADCHTLAATVEPRADSRSRSLGFPQYRTYVCILGKVAVEKQPMLSLAAAVAPATNPTAALQLGEVFTRRWVVDLILDLVGYTPDKDLTAVTALEPACGEGAFLGPMLDRLIESASNHGRRVADLGSAVRGLDLSILNVERARKLAVDRLVDGGVRAPRAERLAKSWIRVGDFLLDQELCEVDFVLGNPPYIRLENVPASRTQAYRTACPTMRGRSDVYVGFIERGLRLLRTGGALGFIVADRWMHNQYGDDLRRFVSDHFSVEAVIEMHDADAFEEEVSAYPAVTVIRRRPQGRPVLVTTDRTFSWSAAKSLSTWVAAERTNRTFTRPGFRAARLSSWFPGDELWPSGDPARLAIVSDLEKRFPALEDRETGTRVGIGVATGADNVFITRDRECAEGDRLLPLVTARDVATGTVRWSGSLLANPWQDGQLLDLARYPRLASYFRANEQALRARHIARLRPATWYRTIDRVDPALATRPKLLLPDIKAASHPVLDEGRFYPHHNLYFVVSDVWDLEVLGGLLLSDVTNLFVGAYCVKMRGGSYRFQAQYLRKVRLPSPHSLKMRDRRALARAFQARDVDAATEVSLRLFGLNNSEARDTLTARSRLRS